ncbi:MAG: site-2 protease family protein [Saprospiraceae bacterium]|nr:site-2 protease family protein [Saprospiraceae bacterium]
MALPKGEKDLQVQLLRSRYPQPGGAHHCTRLVKYKQVPLGIGARFSNETENFSLLQSFPKGWKKWSAFLGANGKPMAKMFSGEIKVTESLGASFRLVACSPQNGTGIPFWNLTAMLSLVLAFINLLPIPALDGGHVMFLLFEVLTGKKPSDKFMEIATMVGFVPFSFDFLDGICFKIPRCSRLF